MSRLDAVVLAMRQEMIRQAGNGVPMAVQENGSASVTIEPIDVEALAKVAMKASGVSLD